MTMPPKPSTHEATEIVRRAIYEHGRPAWVTHVPYRFRQLVPIETMRELLNGPTQTQEIRNMPKDGREAILKWCESHVFALVRVKALAGIGGVSDSTVRNLIKERPDIFKKCREGAAYEIRDPKADREIDKRKKVQ